MARKTSPKRIKATARKTTTPRPWYRQRPIQLALLVVLLLTTVAYVPSLSNGWVIWDDPDYVTDNTLIYQLNGANLKAIFTESIAYNYHPLTILSLGINYAFAGDNAVPYHYTNLALHLINCVLVFLFVYRLFKSNWQLAFFVALFFGIHPMHVESVAWVTERKDLLYTLFFIPALLAYLRYVRGGNRRYLLFTVGWFLLSLLSKPAAVTLPLVLLLIDWFERRRFTTRVALEKVPFFVLSVLFGLLTYAIQEEVAVKSVEEIGFLQRICFAGYGFLTYLWKSVVPINLAAFYPYPPVNAVPGYFYAFPVAALALTGGLLYAWRNKRPYLFGFGFFVLVISIALQLLSFGAAIMADRYTYVPFIGLFIVYGIFLLNIVKKQPKWRNLVYGGVGIYTLVLTAATWQQCKTWQNSGTLWTAVIERTAYGARSATALSNRGTWLKQQGETEAALADFNAALAIDHKDATARQNRANIYFNRQELNKAVADYDILLSQDPNNAKALSNKGAAVSMLGQNDEAIRLLNRALEVDPRLTDAWKNRAVLHFQTAAYAAAIRDYQKYLEFYPNNADFHNAIGVAYQRLNDWTASITAFDQAIRLTPNQGLFYLNRSYSKNARGQRAEAYADAQRARQLGAAVDAAYWQTLQ